MADKKLTLREARKISEPVVYALSGADGDFVYVGMTINPKSRLECYLYPGSCHNPALAEWLSQNECFVTILHRGEDGLEAAEIAAISERRDSLFNMVEGGEQAWLHRTRKPWHAGRGVMRCPSGVLMAWLKCRSRENPNQRNLDGLKRFIARMTDDARVLFEVSLAMDFHEHGSIGKSIRKWLDATDDRLIAALENGCGG